MKRFLKFMAVALAMSLLAIGCYPEVLAPDQGLIPQASELEVEISVDNETNYVTFTMKNQGMVPVWIFGEEMIDGKPGTRYSYTANGLKLRFREAGEHSVEVKAYNAHGVSIGSIVKTFSLENTYRDPFDATPYMKVMAGEWMWNSSVAGHFGCGAPGGNGLDWWSCEANGKADWSMYDDRLQFTADGKYTYTSGDGYIYMHNSVPSEYLVEAGVDFIAPIKDYTVDYTLENSWNDAGIEEIYVVLPANASLSYVSSPEILANPRYRLLETKPADMKKCLKFIVDMPTTSNPDGIAWHYEFVPSVKTASPEELLAGTGANGKVWVMDSAAKGHLGCGESVDNPAGWWSANADEKKDFGLYDDEITFYPDGKYVYSSGPDGKMYINWGVTAIGPNPGAEPDIDIEWPLTESTYEFDGETITLAPNTPMVYVPSDKVWNEPVFHVTELTETKLIVVAENPGCYWQMIFRARDVQEEPEGPSVAPFDPAADENMWKSAALTVTYWFANSSWGQIADPEASLGDNEYTFVVPEGVGGSEWQGQVVFRNTGLAISTDKTYDFRAVISATNDGTATIKPCWEHPTELDGNGNPADVNELFYDNAIAVTAYEDLEYVKAGLAGTDIPDLKLVLDFGRFPAGTTVTVKGIVIRESKMAPVVPEQPDALDPDSDANMWKNAKTDNISFWFANGDWGQIANPEMQAVTGGWEIAIPEGTGPNQWQGQMAVNNTGLVVTPGKTYDFQVTLNSTEDHPHVTVKGCWADPGELNADGNPTDKNELFYKNDIKLSAYEDCVVTLPNLAGTDIPDFKLIFDFGGAVSGSEVTITGITLIER